MTGEQTIYARAGIGVVCAAASLISLNIDRFRRGSSRAFDRLSTFTLVFSRITIFAFVFLVLRIPPRGDIPAYYFPQALKALHGAIPYRDMLTSYAPLHPYLDAAAIFLWRSPLSIILLAICVEAFLLPVWLRTSRFAFSEQHVRTAALLYVTSPISILFVAIDGQDNVIIAILLALATLACYRRRDIISGALLGLGIVLVKFLPLIFAPVFMLIARRRFRWIAGFTAALLLGYGGLVLLHASILYPFVSEARTRTASNLPYLLESLAGIGPHPRLEDALLLFSFLGIFALIACAAPRLQAGSYLRVLIFGPAAITLALLLFSRKSWPPYLMFALFPLCLLIHGRSRRWFRAVLFAFFSVVAVVSHSFWSTSLRQVSAINLHRMLIERGLSPSLFMALQLLLIGGYLWLLAQSTGQIIFARRLSQTDPSAYGPSVREDR